MADSKWSVETKALAEKLHSHLTINNQDWHKKKSDPAYRTAELLCGALIQLLQEGKNSDVEALSMQAIKWLKGDLKDPGCPHR